MRLIDADELMEHVWRDKLDSRELIAKMVDNAPTVKEIPTKIPIDIFEQLVSQEPKWIPVSERLPKDDGLYLVYTEEQPFVCEFENGEFFIDEVLAWMPLPEPYKAESEEQGARVKK